MSELIAVTILFLGTFWVGFYWGWGISRSKMSPIAIQSIEKYVKTQFPDQWQAYKKGVNEGYEQGLRDGQEVPDESA